MRRPLARALPLATVLLAACAPSPPAHPYPLTAARPAQPYPAVFDVLPDDDLNDWAREFERKTPGWTIRLDSFGMLATALCDACKKTDLADLVLTDDDRRRIDDFLTAHGETLLGLQGRRMNAITTDTQIICRQTTRAGKEGEIWIDRVGGTLHIDGHFWPGVPAPEGWLPDDALEAKLHALDPAPGQSVSYRYVQTLSREWAKIEIHEAACLRPPDAPSTPGPAPLSSCIDTRSGERLTPLCDRYRAPTWGKMTRYFVACD